MHFLIYVPGGRDVGDLAEVGLSDLAEGAFPNPSSGPEVGEGVLFGWPTHSTGSLPPIVYRPEAQTWVSAQARGDDQPAGRYFVGFWNGRRPTPGELRRPRFYGGHNVPLGDGNEWAVPDCSQLPHAYVYEDGDWQLKVKSPFQSTVERAKAWKALYGNRQTIPTRDALDFAVHALSINHRLTIEVANYLELFTSGDDGTALTCFAHCIGAEGVTHGQ